MLNVIIATSLFLGFLYLFYKFCFTFTKQKKSQKEVNDATIERDARLILRHIEDYYEHYPLNSILVSTCRFYINVKDKDGVMVKEWHNKDEHFIIMNREKRQDTPSTYVIADEYLRNLYLYSSHTIDLNYAWIYELRSMQTNRVYKLNHAGMKSTFEVKI